MTLVLRIVEGGLGMDRWMLIRLGGQQVVGPIGLVESGDGSGVEVEWGTRSREIVVIAVDYKLRI